MISIFDELSKFADEYKFTSKGPLCVALHLTRVARKQGLPLDQNDLLAERGGQVKGLGKGAVQSVLKDYGIIRVLAEEGGRTSRGSIDNTKRYCTFLNRLKEQESVDLKAVESWWVERVRSYFGSKPLTLKSDSSKSIRFIIGDVLGQALKRQKDNPGTMYVGTVLQHLVGAKLELVLPKGSVTRHGASVADHVSFRNADFVIGNCALHCTTSPSEALMRKCQGNLSSNLHPIIITFGNGVSVADAMLEQFEIIERVDVLEATQFLAGNLHEHGLFNTVGSRDKTSDLIDVYNSIVEECETDPSLRIELS